MPLPGTPSLFYLAYLLLGLPSLAFRSAGQIRAARSGVSARPLPSRERIWLGTLVMQASLLALSLLVGSSFGFRFFVAPPLDARTVLAAAGGLAALLALRAVARAVRSEAERRQMTVYLLAARTRREWIAKIATIFVTAVAEEIAYRGVLFAILDYTTGSTALAIAVSAAAFAAAHWTQDWKSMAVILAMALVFHAVVLATGTLVVAMVLHAAYDLFASYWIAKEARGFDREAAATPAGR